jgi:hypothetical protein
MPRRGQNAQVLSALRDPRLGESRGMGDARADKSPASFVHNRGSSVHNHGCLVRKPAGFVGIDVGCVRWQHAAKPKRFCRG